MQEPTVGDVLGEEARPVVEKIANEGKEFVDAVDAGYEFGKWMVQMNQAAQTIIKRREAFMHGMRRAFQGAEEKGGI